MKIKLTPNNTNYSQEILDAYEKLKVLSNGGNKFNEGKQICKLAKLVLDGRYSTEIVDEYLAGCDWVHYPEILEGFVQEAGKDTYLVDGFGINEALDYLEKDNSNKE